MRDYRKHYLTSNELKMLKILSDDMKLVLKINPQSKAGQFPTERVREWAAHLDILHWKHTKFMDFPND